MKAIGVIFFIFSLESIAQSNHFLSLDVVHLYTTKRIKYFEQEKITFKLKGKPFKYEGIITALTDSSLTLNGTEVYLYKNISIIMLYRATHLEKTMSFFITGCGAGYMAIDAFNHITNGDRPILRWLDVGIGVGLMAIGQSFRFFFVKHYKINKKRTLYFMDITP